MKDSFDYPLRATLIASCFGYLVGILISYFFLFPPKPANSQEIDTSAAQAQIERLGGEIEDAVTWASNVQKGVLALLGLGSLTALFIKKI